MSSRQLFRTPREGEARVEQPMPRERDTVMEMYRYLIDAYDIGRLVRLSNSLRAGVA